MRLIGSEPGRVLGHDQIAGCRQDNPRGKPIADAGGEFPAREVDGHPCAIEQLHVLVLVSPADRVVHQLADHDGFRTPRGIGRAGGGLGQPTDLRGPIGLASRADPVFLGSEPHGIQDPFPGGVHQIEGLTRRTEGEPQLILIQDEMPACGNPRTDREPEPIGGNRVGQHTTHEIQLRVRGVEELDEIELGIVGVREEFVDHQTVKQTPSEELRSTRSAANTAARHPRPRIRGSVARSGQHQ